MVLPPGQSRRVFSAASINSAATTASLIVAVSLTGRHDLAINEIARSGTRWPVAVLKSRPANGLLRWRSGRVGDVAVVASGSYRPAICLQTRAHINSLRPANIQRGGEPSSSSEGRLHNPGFSVYAPGTSWIR